MEVNILGTRYEVKFENELNDIRLCDCSGYCDPSIKKIVVDDFKGKNSHPLSIGDLSALQKKILRHELIHAFLSESGLQNWSENEDFVDWIALQMPKIAEAERGVLDGIWSENQKNAKKTEPFYD